MLYVKKCQHNKWTVLTWDKENPEEQKARLYRCRSWRHIGECATWRAESDFARISEGLSKHGPWMHVVLTYHNWRGRDVNSLWKVSLVNWAKLRKRITREWGDFLYVQTWEATRKDCPHCHMALANIPMWRQCLPIPQGLEKDQREYIAQVNFDRIVGAHAQACGFGHRGWAEAIYGQKGFVKYLEKLKRELTQAAGKGQSPLKAPRHFRRLRASRGLIPPPFKADWITGCLIDEHGQILERRKAALQEPPFPKGEVPPD